MSEKEKYFVVCFENQAMMYIPAHTKEEAEETALTQLELITELPRDRISRITKVLLADDKKLIAEHQPF